MTPGIGYEICEKLSSAEEMEERSIPFLSQRNTSIDIACRGAIMNITYAPDLLEGGTSSLASLPLAIIDRSILPGGSLSGEVGVEWR
jgi:hypothetical protein